jgi:hypothetical protein
MENSMGDIVQFRRRDKYPHIKDAVMFALGALAMLAYFLAK